MPDGATLDDRKAVIQVGTHPFGKHGQNSFGVIEEGGIVWYTDKNGVDWYSERGVNNSPPDTFEVLERRDWTEDNALIIWKAKINCNLYNDSGASIRINGEFRAQTLHPYSEIRIKRQNANICRKPDVKLQSADCLSGNTNKGVMFFSINDDVVSSQQMKFYYNYIFYHFYDLGLKVKNRQARESAILYISVLAAVPTTPLLIGILNKLFGKIPYFIMAIVVLFYAFFIVKLNRRYFDNKKKLQGINNQFKTENRLQRKIGYIIVVSLLLFSFALFWFLLSLM